ncbi:putative glutamine amidotransferase [Mycobacterium frederiksbergense]|uniref:Glutamine amidotransferase n=1 Tax=Mycolicibacterium frederiksbergense TaxID=117567 RepID=A0ABT6KZD5_9MYCO|nr:gamma-glutamyl-gamma-aminobutyrate hydrolase family protein [Mycolicibacterium frederiksbergense]MDH6195993.1 putative glutamine amidotransferase [Mycolicibacterium frederiksbergense]
MSAPVIGISSYRESASWGIWRGVEANLVPTDYVRCVQVAGGIPLVVPILNAADGHARRIVAQLDGLVIAGGPDIGPERYGDVPHPATGGVQAERDEWELSLLHHAYERDLPVLGICRGMQLMAVAGGGSLIQDVADQLGDDRHTIPVGDYCPTTVDTVSGSVIGSLFGDTVAVRCHHHQSVRAHPGFETTARCGAVVEAMESPAHTFRVGVQWHPEVSAQPALFARFVGACRSVQLESAL